MVKWIVVMKIQPRICLDDWGKPRKTPVRLVGTGIRARDLPNASLVRYHGATSLGMENIVRGFRLWTYCCCYYYGLLFNDGHVLQLCSEIMTDNVWCWMMHDGHMITGDECSSNFLTFVLRPRENPGKNPNQEIHPTGDRTRARCVRSNNVTPRPQRWSTLKNHVWSVRSGPTKLRPAGLIVSNYFPVARLRRMILLSFFWFGFQSLE